MFCCYAPVGTRCFVTTGSYGDAVNQVLHITTLRDLGVYLIEHVDLEELAADEAYEFLFMAAPLRLPKATGSPMTPLAFV